MLDWLGKMLELPKEFLACSGGKGGGVIQVIFLTTVFNNFLLNIEFCYLKRFLFSGNCKRSDSGSSSGSKGEKGQTNQRATLRMDR